MSVADDYDIALIGGGIAVAGYVYNILSPLIYGSSYNNRLLKAMSLTPNDLANPNSYSFNMHVEGMPRYSGNVIYINLFAAQF